MMNLTSTAALKDMQPKDESPILSVLITNTEWVENIALPQGARHVKVRVLDEAILVEIYR